jgi:hypothetical protein
MDVHELFDTIENKDDIDDYKSGVGVETFDRKTTSDSNLCKFSRKNLTVKVTVEPFSSLEG